MARAAIERALPYRDADRFVRLLEAPPAEAVTADARPAGLSRTELDVLRARAETLSNLGTYLPATVTLASPEAPARVNGIRISPSVFEMLGVAPALGRLFRPGEEAAGQDRVVIHSHGLWLRRFGGDAGVLGRRVLVDGDPHVVVGVMPAGFGFPDAGADFWMPFAWPSRARLVIVGRLADGATFGDASSEVTRLLRFARMAPGDRAAAMGLPPPPPPPPPPGVSAAEAPPIAAPAGRGSSRRSPTFRAVSLHGEITGQLVSPIASLAFAATCVLLIACTNVSSLLLARAVGRRREMFVRTALGAGPGRLFRQTLAEQLLLIGAAGAAGVGITAVTLRWLRVIGSALPRRDMRLSPGIPGLAGARIDGEALAFALAMSIVCVLAVGLLPALRQSRRSVVADAHDGHERHRSILVAVSQAVAVTLAIGAALLVQSVVRLSHVDPGYDPSGVTTFQIVEPLGRPAQPIAEALVVRLGTMAGIDAAGYAASLPMGFGQGVTSLRTAAAADAATGPPAPPPGGSQDPDHPDLRIVSPGFLRVLGVRVLQGRGLTEGDGSAAPRVMLVNRRLAASGFLGPEPVGALVYAMGSQPWEVVGVVEDIRQYALDREPGPQVFVNYAQLPSAARLAPGSSPFIAVRSSEPAASLVPRLRAALAEVDERSPLDNISALSAGIDGTIVRPRFFAVLAAVFAFIAASLALVGVYGIVFFATARRIPEIATRLALGGTPLQIAHAVIGRIWVATAAGTCTGILGAVLAGRALRHLLFGLSPLDPPTIVAVPGVLALAAGLAALWPYFHALRSNPYEALRQD